MVSLEPDPVVVIPPVYLVNVQVPSEGNPSRMTLPVDNVQVGGVICPTEGAGGANGWIFTVKLSD